MQLKFDEALIKICRSRFFRAYGFLIKFPFPKPVWYKILKNQINGEFYFSLCYKESVDSIITRYIYTNTGRSDVERTKTDFRDTRT
ncbi:MAG: hypothetical protein Tsb0021_17470 [Chlamydiales bacterium]